MKKNIALILNTTVSIGLLFLIYIKFDKLNPFSNPLIKILLIFLLINIISWINFLSIKSTVKDSSYTDNEVLNNKKYNFSIISQSIIFIILFLLFFTLFMFFILFR